MLEPLPDSELELRLGSELPESRRALSKGMAYSLPVGLLGSTITPSSCAPAPAGRPAKIAKANPAQIATQRALCLAGLLIASKYCLSWKLGNA